MKFFILLIGLLLIAEPIKVLIWPRTSPFMSKKPTYEPTKDDIWLHRVLAVARLILIVLFWLIVYLKYFD